MLLIIPLVTAVLAHGGLLGPDAPLLRPPAYPLVTCDPYFSTWSMTDSLAGSWPRHWSGGTTGMCGMVRVDGTAYRWCGMAPSDVAAATQTGVWVTSTATIYSFHAGPIDFTVTFESPLGDCTNLEAASRSMSTVTVDLSEATASAHNVQVYLDVSGEWVVHDPSDQVNWSRHRIAGHDAVSMGSVSQRVLEATGDARRIDWGRLYVAGLREGDAVAAASHNDARRTFATTGTPVASDSLRMPRSADDDFPVLAVVSEGGMKTCLVYDDQFSIELFERRLRPLWNRDGQGVERAIQAAIEKKGNQEPSLDAATRVGGPAYAELVKLAYRQVLAGNKIVADWDGTPLMFPKENTSNGCIATVDVIYPACPFFLYHNPEMLKAQLRPLMMYAQSNRWKFPFAPHDLGQYPKANGQVYGGGEATEDNQMPVEESGNMLIMLAALAKVEKSAAFSAPYIPMLEKWAEYLKQHGLDPANQLCTDDFAGHLARNANLSAKTVVALGAYAQLLETAGEKDRAAKWNAVARDFATRWIELSRDGDHTVLAFGTSGTWSQKYNLIWDRVLGLKLFPDEVFAREEATYRSHLTKLGLPLDSRRTYTKLDWTVWSACLTGSLADFDAIMPSVYSWVNQTPTRVPLTDWYETTDGRTMGMHSRPVVGGIWMPLLMDKLGAGLR